MGSDLSMAAAVFHPRRTKAFLTKRGRWVIYQDLFISGYTPMPDTHKDTPEVRRLMRSLGWQFVMERPHG